MRLVCTNRQCDAINAEQLQLLLDAASDDAEASRRFEAVDRVEVDVETLDEETDERLADHGGERGAAREAARAELEADLWASFFDDKDVPRMQTFAVGARVLLNANEPPGGFVNGDLGEVIGFPTSFSLTALPLSTPLFSFTGRRLPSTDRRGVRRDRAERAAAARWRGLSLLSSRALSPRRGLTRS